MSRHSVFIRRQIERAAPFNPPSRALRHGPENRVSVHTRLVLNRDALNGPIGPHLDAQLYHHVLDAVDPGWQGPATFDLAPERIDLADAEAGFAELGARLACGIAPAPGPLGHDLALAPPVHLLDATQQRGELVLLGGSGGAGVGSGAGGTGAGLAAVCGGAGLGCGLG